MESNLRAMGSKEGETYRSTRFAPERQRILTLPPARNGKWIPISLGFGFSTTGASGLG
jgi:hypothetical protein